MVAQNRRWVLARRPTGIVGREHFDRQEAPVPSIGEGEFLVRNLWLSCDVAQRGWMEMDMYVPMVPLGEVMRSGAAGEVVESKHPDFMKGDLASGIFGWQDYAVSDAQGFGGGLLPPQKIPAGVDIPSALSLFGVNGGTAYFGLLDVGWPNAGNTVAHDTCRTPWTDTPRLKTPLPSSGASVSLLPSRGCASGCLRSPSCRDFMTAYVTPMQLVRAGKPRAATGARPNQARDDRENRRLP